MPYNLLLLSRAAHLVPLLVSVWQKTLMNNVLDMQPATPTASDATHTTKWEQRPLVPDAFWFVRDN